jgi:hypothetical protein
MAFKLYSGSALRAHRFEFKRFNVKSSVKSLDRLGRGCVKIKDLGEQHGESERCRQVEKKFPPGD